MTENIKSTTVQSKESEDKMNSILAQKHISTQTVYNPRVQGGKKGFVDDNGEWLIPAIYDDVDVFREGVCWVKTGGKWGLINEIGETLIEPRYDDAREFNDGYANVKLGSKWGVVDENGVEVLKPQYSRVEDFRQRSSEASTRGDYYGCIDRDGNYVVKPKFQEIAKFKDGLAIVRIDGKWGIINTVGAYVVEPSSEKPEYNASGKPNAEDEEIKSPKFVKIKKNGKIGIADLEGNTILAPLYAAIIWNKEEQVFTAEIAEYADDSSVDSDPEIDDFDIAGYRYWNSSLIDSPKGKWGIFDKSGNTILAPTYSVQLEFSEGLAAVSVGNKWGFINPAGEMVIAPRFENAENFKIGLGMALAKEYGHPCIIDIKGDYIVKPVYERLFFLNGNDGCMHGYICFTTDGKNGIIDRKGRNVVEPKFYEILSEDTDMAEYWDGNVELFGVIDCKTGKATKPIFNKVICISNGIAVVGFAVHQIEAGIQNEPITFS